MSKRQCSEVANRCSWPGRRGKVYLEPVQAHGACVRLLGSVPGMALLGAGGSRKEIEKGLGTVGDADTVGRSCGSVGAVERRGEGAGPGVRRRCRGPYAMRRGLPRRSRRARY